MKVTSQLDPSPASCSLSNGRTYALLDLSGRVPAESLAKNDCYSVESKRKEKDMIILNSKLSGYLNSFVYRVSCKECQQLRSIQVK